MSEMTEHSNICAVFSTASSREEYVSVTGVFLSPRLVLTTYNTGQNLAEMTFENDKGDRSLSAHLKPVAETKALGMAIVELAHPIGKQFARIPEGAYKPFMAGTVVCAFGDKAEKYPVTWDMRHLKHKISHSEDTIVSLSRSFDFAHDNIGAPVFGADGKTLVTMVADFKGANETVLHLGLIDVLDMISGNQPEPGNNILAVNPGFFHRWLQENAASLNLG